MSMLNWAKKEIELACKKENPNWTPNSGDWDYGCACYESALKAFKALCEDGHSGMSIRFTKSILDRLIDGKPLTPITEEDFIIDRNLMTDESLKERGLKSQVQCPRMPSLFRDEYLNGNVSYNDVNRVVCEDKETNITFNYGPVSKLVNELYPIKMPYTPSNKPFKVVMEQFLYDKEDKQNDWDTEAIYYIIEPDGETIHKINKYYKFEGDDNRVEINYDEFTTRKFIANTGKELTK